MPNICIQLYEGRTQAQKSKVAEAITQAFVDHADTNAEGVHIIFVDVAPSNWMVAGKPGNSPAPRQLAKGD